MTERKLTCPPWFYDLERDRVLSDGAQACQPFGLLLYALFLWEESGGEEEAVVRDPDVKNRPYQDSPCTPSVRKELGEGADRTYSAIGEATSGR